MKLLALARAPKDLPLATSVFAEVTQLTPAEARMRLAPEPPSLLARLSEEAALSALARLTAAGLSVLLLDDVVPQDAERMRVRTFAVDPKEGKFKSRAGAELQVRWPEVFLVLRAASATRSATEQTQKSKRFDLSTALLTSGLKMTKKVETSTRTQSVELEQSIFLFHHGGPCVVFREQEVDFSCLGPLMQPVRHANMTALAKLLREHASSAHYDERLTRLGTRPLPFVFSGETRIAAKGVTQTRLNTASGVDVLVEVMRQAALQGLLTP